MNRELYEQRQAKKQQRRTASVTFGWINPWHEIAARFAVAMGNVFLTSPWEFKRTGLKAMNCSTKELFFWSQIRTYLKLTGF